MEFEPMLTPREKSPLPKMSPEEDRTRDTVDSEPKHYQLSYSGPLFFFFFFPHLECWVLGRQGGGGEGGGVTVLYLWLFRDYDCLIT